MESIRSIERAARLILISVSALLFFSAAQTAFSAPASTDFTYMTNNGTIVITGYTGLGGEVNIPASIDGLPVTSIGAGAFLGCINLTGITIPDSVRVIEDGAFWETGLTDVTVPDGVIDFGTAFCIVGLTNMVIGSGVTSITDFAFQGCEELIGVSIGTNVVSIGALAFQGCISLSDIAIPSGVTSIGDQAFDGCVNLRGITVPDSVIDMGYGTFAQSGLTNAVIGARVACIRDSAFDNCRALASISFSTGITSIGYYAFRQCSSLADVTIPSSVTGLVYGAFYYCAGLTNVVLGSGVRVIDDFVFNNCSALDNIAVAGGNSSFSSVDGVLFDKNRNTLIQYPCGRHGGYVVPDGVLTVSSGAFGSCTGLSSIVIPDGVNSIGAWAFQFCDGLKYVTMPGSITRIGAGAFNSCSGLSGLYFEGAPPTDVVLYGNDYGTKIYYLPGVAGWGADLDGWPTLPWNPRVVHAGLGFGPDGSGLFGFTVSGTGTMAVAVEACTNLTVSAWAPVSVFPLSGGTGAFTDAASTNHSARFYRLAMP